VSLTRVSTAVAAVVLVATNGACSSQPAPPPETTVATSTAPTSIRPTTTPPDELSPTGDAGHEPNGEVLVQIPSATGTQALAPFVPGGETLYVTFSCRGPGELALGTLFTLGPCDGSSATVALEGQQKKRLDLTVTTDESTTWRLLIQSGM
jgi:hypothetical protein